MEQRMTQKQTLTLTEAHKKELKHVRDHDGRPWARERCAAILKISTGKSPHWVARKGLLKERDPDTVYFWLKLYKEGGVKKILTRQPGGARRRRL
jgi:hypothetical protein